jgi:hypothetical protein
VRALQDLGRIGITIEKQSIDFCPPYVKKCTMIKMYIYTSERTLSNDFDFDSNFSLSLLDSNDPAPSAGEDADAEEDEAFAPSKNFSFKPAIRQ